jgi:pimeloyl-ACP methyl ester carboxylesterase
MTYYKYANVDGLKIFYREAGDPKQPTILLLHGFPTSSHMFRDLIPFLSDRFHVLAPDYQGMGYSDAPPVDKFIATFDSVADVTEKLLQQLERTRVVIYMQDFGGPVGMRLAVRHPDWIEGLIVQNTPISFDGWNPDRLKAVQALAAPVTPEKRAEAEGRVTLRDVVQNDRGGWCLHGDGVSRAVGGGDCGDAAGARRLCDGRGV